MKLDPDTAREILLHIEHEQNGPGWEWGIGNLQDYKRYYVASKLYEAGLIKANELPGDQPEEDYLVITELTFAGVLICLSIVSNAARPATCAGPISA